MAHAKPSDALLIVEDNEAALRQLRWTFEDHELATAGDRTSALRHVQATKFPVVLLDLGLPPHSDGASEGLATLREILRLTPEAKVIVVTGREEKAHALEAVRLGAYDFYRKPIHADEVRFIVERAFRLYQLEEENRQLAHERSREPLPGIVASSEAMAQLCRTVERAAKTDISVLFIGESGTGKEVLVRALHARSPRSSGPFVAINCAAIPGNLLESELFGYERGAFTGAVKQSPGLLEVADGGTLLLDEIGDMPAELQAKLLRFLEERVVQRIGGRRDIPVNVRIVSATHRNLQALFAQGAFREDLYYRIAELPIEVPPLRERPGDAVLLAHHFFERYRGEAGRPLSGLSGDALAAIVEYAWPGNVRELENRMRRAVVLSDGSQVAADDLHLPGRDGARKRTLKQVIKHEEYRAVARAWAETGGNVSRASDLLGVSRPTLYKLLRDHRLKS